MRNSYSLIGAAVLVLTCGMAAAQESARPAVQVIIGADGCVKVIDPKTGKEFPSVITKLQGQVGQGAAQLDKVLQLALQLQPAPKKEKKADKIEFKLFELQLVPGADGGFRIVQGQPNSPAPPNNVEQKIDKLLAEMQQIRRDVDAIKNKLGMKAPGFQIEIAPGKPPAKEKKPGEFRFQFKPDGGKQIEIEFEFDAATKKKFQEMFKKLEAEKGKKNPKADERNAEIERAIERMIREVEAIRQEIRKSKDRPK